jgi:ABC-type transporter Mla subunit MlaD
MAAARKRSAPKAPKGRKPSRPASAAPTPPADDTIAALRAEVAALSQVVARLGASADLMSATAAELPRADDFQPLADHLYAFAQSAPRLLESLEAVRSAVAPLETAARSLGEVAETLVATHHGWSESLLRLPRAEDYEPLTEPLREFARVSPILAETLAAVVKAVTPLPGMVQKVLGAAETLHPRAASDDALRQPLADAADRMANAHEAIRAGLASLPRDRTYAQAATHLRELATVSPSLMEWLRQLPAMSVPLGDAIASLDEAARELEGAERAARRALDEGS